MEFFRRLFSSDFMPHGHCYQWQPDILWLHVLSDGIITLSYWVIPFILALFVRRRSDMAFKGLFLLFSGFIFLCGATHLLEIWSVWFGTYRLTGLVKAATALMSMGTTCSLVFLFPKTLRLPNAAQLAAANERLKIETEDRLKAEAELAKREETALFQTIVETAPGGILLVGEDGRVAMANSSAEKLFGFTSGRMVDLPLDELVPEEVREGHAELARNYITRPSDRVMATGREIFGVGKHGRRIPLEIGLNPLQWQEQSYVLASLTDISERIRQKQLLEDAHQRFDRAVAGAMEGLWEWHLPSNTVWMSDQFFRILGYDPEKETSSFDFWGDRVHPDDKEEVLGMIDRHFKVGDSYSSEHRIMCADGVYRWVLSRGDSFPDRNGEIVIFSGSLSVIQHRKDAERALAEKTAFLDTIYNGIQLGIFVIDVTDNQDFIFTAFNPAHERLTGIPFAEVAGKRPEELAPKYYPEEAVVIIRSNLRRCLEEKAQIHYTEKLPFRGEDTWWVTHLTPIFDDDRRVSRIIGSAVEITSLKLMEKKTKASEEYARKILDNSLNGLYIFNFKNQEYSYINPAFVQITGYSIEDLEEIGDQFLLYHPDDHPLIRAHLEEIATSKIGESRKIEYRFRHKLGHWIWLYGYDAVFTTVKNSPQEMISTFIDITQIKRYGEKLEESNRELEQFAFIASHDLREPLRKIKSFGDLLVTRFSDSLPERGQDYVRRMANAAERLDHMINDLLAFSRIGQSQVIEEVDLNRVIATVRDDISYVIGESGATFEVDDLPVIRGDRHHMYQLFLNLIGNALKYKREGVAPELRIFSREWGQNVQITVEDNGIGIPETSTEDIFYIFKRLHGKSEFSGNGIGLAVCKKIAERHKGTIWAEPRKEAPGSRFVVALPIDEGG